MTAAVHRSSAALAIPLSQNTAPVLEFKCLFTHDLRQKKKRWQDGFVKYHTFNKRVMLYDVPRNFIGDVHCTQREDLQEGDEITLEKGGAIVQISEAVGKTDTDLTELLQRRDKSDKSSPAQKSSSPAQGRPTPKPSSIGNGGPYPKHKPLHILLGTPRGPQAKATPVTKSPFEERHKGQENQDLENSRPAKRQKTSNATTSKSTTFLHRDASLATNGSVKQRSTMPAADRSQKRSVVNQVIELSSSPTEPPMSSVAGASPYYKTPRVGNARPPSKTPCPLPKTKLHGEQIADRTKPDPLRRSKPNKEQSAVESRTATGKSRPPSRITGHTFQQRNNESPKEREESPHVITTSRATGQASGDGLPDSKPVLDGNADSDGPPRRKGATLKLASNAPRKMLICQDQLSRRPSVKRPDDAIHKHDQVMLPGESEEGLDIAPHRRRLLERLANVGKKKRILQDSSSQTPPPEEPPSSEAFERMEVRNVAGGSWQRSDLNHGALSEEYDVGNATTEEQATAFRASSPSTRNSNLTEMSIRVNLSVAAKGTVAPKKAALRISPSHNADQKTSEEALEERIPSAPTHHSPLEPNQPSPCKITGPAPMGPPISKPLPSRTLTKFKSKSANASNVNLDLRAGADPVTETLLAKPFKAPSRPLAGLAKAKTVNGNNAGSGKNASGDGTRDVDVDTDLGPWSREAFDLFAWRPPDWDAEGRKLGGAVAVVAADGASGAARFMAGVGLSGGVDVPMS